MAWMIRETRMAKLQCLCEQYVFLAHQTPINQENPWHVWGLIVCVRWRSITRLLVYLFSPSSLSLSLSSPAHRVSTALVLSHYCRKDNSALTQTTNKEMSGTLHSKYKAQYNRGSLLRNQELKHYCTSCYSRTKHEQTDLLKPWSELKLYHSQLNNSSNRMTSLIHLN